MDRVRETDCEHAREVVEEIQCAFSLRIKAPETLARYVFRGQGDACWQLMPSAFRVGTVLGYESDKFRRVSDGISKRRGNQGTQELTALTGVLQLATGWVLTFPLATNGFGVGTPFIIESVMTLELTTGHPKDSMKQWD